MQPEASAQLGQNRLVLHHGPRPRIGSRGRGAAVGQRSSDDTTLQLVVDFGRARVHTESAVDLALDAAVTKQVVYELGDLANLPRMGRYMRWGGQQRGRGGVAQACREGGGRIV
eukprot:scaffold567_cov127-Isochrysis_galbana.AAC.2